MPITARMWLPVLALLADGLTIGAANAAPYSVEGFVLGDRISATNSNYRTYTCKQSDDLDEAVQLRANGGQERESGKHYRL